MNDPCRRTWSCGGLGGSRRCPCSTNCSIGQPLPLGALDSQVVASDIVDAQLDAVGVAEVELGQVAVQMGFADVEVAAIDAALEDREVAFEGVGISLVPNVFLGRVVNGLTSGSISGSSN